MASTVVHRVLRGAAGTEARPADPRARARRRRARRWSSAAPSTAPTASAGFLEGAGLRTAVIHGDKTQGARKRALGDFKAGHVSVLVATDVAARGLDIEQLPLVVNFDLPLVAQDYIHRVGRTGRAGLTGEAISLATNAERGLLNDIQKLLPSPIERGTVPASRRLGAGRRGRPAERVGAACARRPRAASRSRSRPRRLALAARRPLRPSGPAAAPQGAAPSRRRLASGRLALTRRSAPTVGAGRYARRRWYPEARCIGSGGSGPKKACSSSASSPRPSSPSTPTSIWPRSGISSRRIEGGLARLAAVLLLAVVVRRHRALPAPAVGGVRRAARHRRVLPHGPAVRDVHRGLHEPPRHRAVREPATTSTST